MSYQNVFLRNEKKYLIKVGVQQQLLDRIGDHIKKDRFGQSRVDSLYLDTPQHLLVRQSIEKPLFKEKLRIRAYNLFQENLVQPDTHQVFIEQKRKFQGAVYKRRVATDINDVRELVSSGFETAIQGESAEDQQVEAQIINELRWSFKRYQPLQPFIQISYLRRAFSERIVSDCHLRITFDHDLNWGIGNWSFNESLDHELIPVDLCLMEIKIDGSFPLWLSNALSELQIYPTSFSKVGNAYYDLRKEGLLV